MRNGRPCGPITDGPHIGPPVIPTLHPSCLKKTKPTRQELIQLITKLSEFRIPRGTCQFCGVDFLQNQCDDTGMPEPYSNEHKSHCPVVLARFLITRDKFYK